MLRKVEIMKIVINALLGFLLLGVIVLCEHMVHSEKREEKWAERWETYIPLYHFWTWNVLKH